MLCYSWTILEVQAEWVFMCIKGMSDAFKTYAWVKCLSSHVLVCVFFPMQGKRLPAYLSADAEEGEVSDDDSADEIEDDFKLKSSNVRERNKSMNDDVHTPKHEPSNYHV